MKSKTSFFNKMIFQKDITRFWPLWTLQLVIGFIGVIIPALSQMSYINNLQTHSAKTQYKIDYLTGYIQNSCLSPYIMAICIVIAASVFLYLTRERETYTMHSFPMKRVHIFTSHYLAGLVMLIVPALIIQLCLMLIIVANGVGVLLPYAGIYLLEWILQVFFYYNLACAVVMVTGNAFMSFVIYGVLNCLVAGVAMLYSMLAEIFVYGNQGFDLYNIVENPLIRRLTPVVFFMIHTLRGEARGAWAYTMGDGSHVVMNYDQVLPEIGKTAFYLIPAALLLAIAIGLYRIRQLESAGDIIAFSWGRPVFRIVFVFCSSLLFAAGVYAIGFGNIINDNAYGKKFNIVLGLVIAGTILFYFIANMILDKSFFIWKKTSYWRMGLFVVLMILGMIGVRNGQFGSGLPAFDKVQRVGVSLEYNGENSYETPTFYLTGTQAIHQAYELNQDILKYGRNIQESSDGNQNAIRIKYTLTGGKERTLYYQVEASGEGKKMMNRMKQFIRKQPDMCELLYGKGYETKLQKAMYVSGMSVEWVKDGDEMVSKWLSEEEGYPLLEDNTDDQELRNELYQALLRDIQDGNCDLFYQEQANSFIVSLTDDGGETRYQQVQITAKCTNTLKVIEKLGLVKQSGRKWETPHGTLGETSSSVPSGD